MARDVLGHRVLIVPPRVGHRHDGHFVAVLLLDSSQDIRERGAMRARSLHEFQEHDLAAIIGQVVDPHLGIGQGKTGCAATGVFTAGEKRRGTQ